MKKGWMALCAAMLLILCAGTALADGQATITRQLAQTYDYGDVFFTYYFAEVQNTGDAPIVLDGGKIVEEGTHKELLAKQGKYAEFIAMREKSVGWKLGSAMQNR